MGSGRLEPLAEPASASAAWRPRVVASWVVFPLMVAMALFFAERSLADGAEPARVLLSISVASILLVVLLERVLPFRREWNRPRGDLMADALYLPTNAGVSAAIEPAATALGATAGAWLSAALGTGLWPVSWPIFAQLALACVVGELFDYWAHRIMHERPLLWRLHATHHSAPRVYWLNATRSHPGEILFRSAVSMLPLSVLGASAQVFVLLAVVNIVVGLFQHANIDFKLGPLSWIFSVGELHRWHHSRDLGEANSNYGNNFIFWDAIFGTRFLPRDRSAPEAVGIAGLDAFPRRYLAQLLAPLRWREIERASQIAAPSPPRS